MPNILTNFDFSKNQIMNVAIHNLAAAPGTPVEGQLYFNTGDKRLYCWNGTAWQAADALGASMTGANIVTAINGSASIIDLDNLAASVGTAVTNSHTHSNKTTLDNVTAAYTTAEQTKLSGIEASADVTDAGNVGPAIFGTVGKTPVVDADTFAITDSASSNALSKITFANLKASIKTYTDTLYNMYAHPNHTGDVTSVGGGATTIATNVVTNAKLAQVATATFKGRNTAGTGDVEDLAVATVKTMLGLVLTETANATGFSIAGGTTSKTLTVSNTLTLAGTDSTTMTFPSTSATIARTDAGQTFTGNQTFSANISAVNAITGYSTTATAAGTTTLTVTSTRQQFFTGTTTQTVLLPVTSTLTLGHAFDIFNNSTGAVTVQSSGGNTLAIMAANTRLWATCVLTSGTTEASWDWDYKGYSIASGKKLTASNTLTFTGTDGSTLNVGTGGTLGTGAFAAAYSHPTGDGNLHVPANGTGNNGNVLTASGTAGTYTWATPTVTWANVSSKPSSTTTAIDNAVTASHTQNTDTGTTSTTFTVGSSGVKIKNSGGTELQVRVNADTDYGDLRVRNLVVEGTTTTINSNTVAIGDSEIELNSDITTSAANSDGGLAIKRLMADNTTRKDAKLTYNQSNGYWQSTFGDVAETLVTAKLATKFSQSIGNGSATSYVVTHNLNTRDLTFTIRETAGSYAMVITDVEFTTVNTATIRFATAPSSNQYTVTFVG